MLKLLIGLVALSMMLACDGHVQAAATINSIGPTSSRHMTNLNAINRSRSLDFKKQELPKTIPTKPKTESVPKLDSLIDQMIRHSDLRSSATKIMPWVYTTTSESVVADYEEAVTRLEFADHCLQRVLHNLLIERESLEVDPMLVEATTEIDHAEFTILLLLEIAKLEL